jgi:2,3-bisphosphoglycerate-independent phosphoglycerate mutase
MSQNSEEPLMSEDITTHAMSEAVRAAYRRGEEEETLEPLVLVDAQGDSLGRIQDGDYVIFYDIRGEREIELTASMTEPDFDEFNRRGGGLANFVTMIQYHADLPVRVAFPPPGTIENTLAEVISDHDLRLTKVAETEKAIHVSFFFNGKRRDPVPGETRIFVESPGDVDDYSLVPELSAKEVTQTTKRVLEAGDQALVMTNFANVDVIGHIENEAAVRTAVETVDCQIGALVEAAQELGYTTLITADHGTVEKWYYPDGAVDTGHTDSPVPFIVVPATDSVAENAEIRLRQEGELPDVAPTILSLLDLAIPPEMTGRSLLADAPEDWLACEKKILFIIADGWGWQSQTEGNLIAQANTPNMDALQAEYPFTTLKASGPTVGMPEGSVGNSESGHLHLGTGRRVASDRLRIDQALENGEFYENEAFLWAMNHAKAEGKPLHLLGIVSFYSSHGSVDHLLALMKLAKQQEVPELYMHAMLGRRGEQPESGANYVALVENEAAKLGLGHVASVIGRFWSLDREENWDRIEKTYNQLVHGEGRPVPAGES